MDRFALAELREWKTRRSRKPLVMRGARQVGKTWLVRQLAATEFESLLEVNFEQTPGAAALFASNDPAKILPLLAAQFGQKVEPGRTLLFLDEVQAAPQVLLSLRYFFEKMPALHVIAAGSLLEFALADHSFSMPVGRIEYFFLDPMTFGEFLCASGRGSLLDFLRSWRRPDAFPAPIHAECMELLRRYLAVGGMPESVAAFLDGGADFEASERARQGILSTFADDFAKYSRRVPVENVRKVFESVPRQLGEKFTWAKVDREVRSASLAAALDLLCKARVASKVRRTSGSGLPFGADADEKNFKALFLDVGLASLACDLRSRDLVGAEDLLLGNRGAVSEQFVGQELAAARPPWEPRDLFCWARECRSSNAEVDYLGASGGRIYPVEVKSGATGRLKSMHQFLAEKGTDFGLRFNGDAPSFVKTDFPDGAGARRPFRLLSLPLYLASEARRLVARSAFFAVLALSLGLSPSVRAAWTFDSSAETLSEGTFVLRNVTVSGSTLTIGDNKSNADIAGDVDLSSGIAGGYVVKLGGSCFQGNSSLTGFKSGAELIATGNNAFQSCSALTNADLSASTGLTALSPSLFNSCKKLRRVAIPSTVATIGSSAFQNCSALEMDVNDLLPSGLSGALYRTFYNCPKLYGDVVLPAGVTAISGDFAKSAITSFRTAEGSALAAIGHSSGYSEDATFGSCAALTNVVFQDTIATFYGQNNHFQNCSALVNLTLPGITAPSGHVVSGGGGAKDWSSTFRDCLVLTNAFTIPDDVTGLTQTFDGSKCIRGVTLGKSVRQIGNFRNSESAFTDNRALEFVDMSATTNLTDIGQLNFSSCQALRELTIPNTVTNIGREAFVNCTSLTNLVLPAGLQKIGPRAFKNVAKNTGLLCDIWWSGTPDAPPSGIGTSDSVMGNDEGANYRITHHFWIEDEGYWAAWASDNAAYVELPSTEKRKAKGTWKDHNNRTQYVMWWYPRDFTLMVFR